MKVTSKISEVMNTNSLLIYYLLGINIVAFALYGIDKLKSKKWMVAHTGKDIAHACGYRWKYGSFVWNTIVPPQNKA